MAYGYRQDIILALPGINELNQYFAVARDSVSKCDLAGVRAPWIETKYRENSNIYAS